MARRNPPRNRKPPQRFVDVEWPSSNEEDGSDMEDIYGDMYVVDDAGNRIPLPENVDEFGTAEDLEGFIVDDEDEEEEEADIEDEEEEDEEYDDDDDDDDECEYVSETDDEDK